MTYDSLASLIMPSPRRDGPRPAPRMGYASRGSVCDSEDWGQEHEAAVAELKAASEELHKIQIERLCFPDWKETLNKS
jgi:hypothetical protein